MDFINRNKPEVIQLIYVSWKNSVVILFPFWEIAKLIVFIALKLLGVGLVKFNGSCFCESIARKIITGKFEVGWVHSKRLNTT